MIHAYWIGCIYSGYGTCLLGWLYLHVVYMWLWLGPSDLYQGICNLEGGLGDAPCCILVVFSTAPPFRQLVRGCLPSPGDGEKILCSIAAYC